MEFGVALSSLNVLVLFRFLTSTRNHLRRSRTKICQTARTVSTQDSRILGVTAKAMTMRRRRTRGDQMMTMMMRRRMV